MKNIRQRVRKGQAFARKKVADLDAWARGFLFGVAAGSAGTIALGWAIAEALR